MISPSSVTNSSWPAASLQNKSASAGATPDFNVPAAVGSDSFQDILAQVVTPQPVNLAFAVCPNCESQVGQSSPVETVAIHPAGSPRTSATSKADQETSVFPAVNGSAQKDLAASTASRSSDRTNAKATTRMATQRIGAGKQEYESNAPQTPVSRASETANAGSTGNQTVFHQPQLTPTPTSVSGSGSGEKSSPSPSVEQNGPPVVATTVALNGLKSLPGAAFAMHITPAASQSNGIHNDTSQNNAGQNNAGQNNPNRTNASPRNASQANGRASSGASDATSPNPSESVGAGTSAPLLSASGDLAVNGAHAQAIPDTTPNAANLPAAMHIVSSASAAPLASLNDHAASAESTPRIGETREIAEQGPVAAPQPVRTLQLQLAREGEGRVDLRLVEHAGGLSVTVRASDSALTRGLQDNLPELSARLAADKYQTHILLPAANEASTTLAGSSDQPAGKSYEPGGGRNFSQNGAGSGGDGAGRQNSGQHGGQSGGEQNQPSAWWRQMAALGKLSSADSSYIQSSQADPAASPAINQ